MSSGGSTPLNPPLSKGEARTPHGPPLVSGEVSTALSPPLVRGEANCELPIGDRQLSIGDCRSSKAAVVNGEPSRVKLLSAGGGAGPGWFVFIGVVALAVATNVLSFLATPLWVCPDTSWYVELAGAVADRGEFGHELFVIRPYGYPLLLAAVFRLFGEHSAVAIQALQHLMAVGIAVVTALIGWEMTRRRGVALAAGIFSACGLQLLAFTNVIIAEVPYTFTMMLTLYFVVRFHRSERLGCLVAASVFGGLATLFRQIGLSMLAVCMLAAVWHVWRNRRISNGAHRPATPAESWSRVRHRFGFTMTGLGAAIAPGLLVLSPWMAQNMVVHAAGPMGRLAPNSFYHRLLRYDELDPANSATMNEIRRTVQEAIALGKLPPNADYRYFGTVWRAYEAVYGMSLVDSSEVIQSAARELLGEHTGTILDRTLRYGFWMLMTPDAFYRFQAGGAPGITTPAGDSVRDATAELFDVSTYAPMLEPWVTPCGGYLLLDGNPRWATPLWSAIARHYYRWIDQGSPIPCLGGTAYQSLTWVCLIGMGCCLLTSQRSAWAWVATVFALHLVLSAFVAGPTPRYAVPLQPILALFAAGGATASLRGVVLPGIRWKSIGRPARTRPLTA